MNTIFESNAEQNNGTQQDACLEKTFTTLTVDDVYEIAKLIGSDVERLIDGFGKESAENLVPKIVKVLELLESFAARNHHVSSKDEELLKAYETLQVQQQKKRGLNESVDCSNMNEMKDLQQKEQRWSKRSEELHSQVLQLQAENQELLNQLRSSHTQDDHAQRQEREVMLKLKAVVDMQRDEIRAKSQEISALTKEGEALQEQLDRFMKMNGELRHKQGIVQAQMRSAVERRADLEADLQEKRKEMERLSAQLEAATTHATANVTDSTKTGIDLTDKMIIDLKDPNRPCFTKQEVRDMISERNELKTNLFLIQEELSYYQREILNEERYPGLLLKAMHSAIRKQKTVIKAKMLGIQVNDSSEEEEEDKGPLSQSGEAEALEDCTDSRPPDSRIRNLFGFLIRRSSGSTPSQPNTGSSWEILSPDDTESPEEAVPWRSP